MSVIGLFDGLLCLGLLGLAWAMVSARSLFCSVVLFMVFGLLMAVAWTRLDAPDLALAEAIIGAGVTGALLLNACQSIVIDRQPQRPAHQEPPTALPRPLLAVGCALLGLFLAWLLSSLQPSRTSAIVADEVLPEHVLANPVTAVLLDFRGYDTLLEMAVLLLALLGARVLNLQGRLPEVYPNDAPRSVLVDPLAALIIPAMMLMAAYLFWTGSTHPGGAFQAGSMLAAVGILLRLNGRMLLQERPAAWLRAALVLGLLVFTLFALTGLFWSDQAMTYPLRGSYPLMVAIEGSLTLSIAATLILLFADAPGVRLRRYR